MQLSENMRIRMPRPKKPINEKKQKVTITLNKSMYKNLKKRGLNISGTIEQLLRVALFNDYNQSKDSDRYRLTGVRILLGSY